MEDDLDPEEMRTSSDGVGSGDGDDGDDESEDDDEGEGEDSDDGDDGDESERVSDPYGFVLGSAASRKRPRRPAAPARERDPGLLAYFERARRRAGHQSGARAPARQLSVASDDGPKQDFSMHQPRERARRVVTPRPRRQPDTPERDEPPRATVPRRGSAPRRGNQQRLDEVCSRMQARSVAPAAPAEPARPRRAASASSLPATAPTRRAAGRSRRFRPPQQNAAAVHPLRYLGDPPPRLLPLAAGTRLASLEPTFDGAASPTAGLVEAVSRYAWLQTGEQLCDKLPGLFQLCNSGLALLQLLHRVGRDVRKAQAESIRATAGDLAFFLPRLHAALAATVPSLGTADAAGRLAQALVHELTLLRAQGPIASLLPVDCRGDDGAEDALARGHLQLRWVCLRWLRRLSEREDFARRCAPHLAHEADATVAELLPLAGDTPTQRGVRAPLPGQHAPCVEPDAPADRPVMALWHELRLALDGARPAEAGAPSAPGPADEMTPFWQLLTTRLGAAATTLDTPHGTLPVTAQQRVGWQWRCLAYVAPLYGLDDSLSASHAASWPHGGWPLVRQMLENSRLNPEASLPAGAEGSRAAGPNEVGRLLLRLCCDLSARWPPHKGDLAYTVWTWQWQLPPVRRAGTLLEDTALPDLAAWCSREQTDRPRALDQDPSDSCRTLALRFLVEQLLAARVPTRIISKLSSWADGRAKGEDAGSAGALHPAAAAGAGEGSSGKGDVFWGLVEAALLVAEMQPGNARALENGSRWLKTLFAVGPHAPPWRLRVLVEAQAQLVKAAQRKPANTPAPARGLNEMVLTLAKAPNEAPSGLLEKALEHCTLLLSEAAAASSPGGATDLLGGGVAHLVRRGQPGLCSYALRVVEAALEAAQSTSGAWGEALGAALLAPPWWQGERSPMQERLETAAGSRQHEPRVGALDAPPPELSESLVECWARTEAFLLGRHDRPEEMLGTRAAVLRGKGALPCTFLAALLRHCSRLPERGDALRASVWARYGSDIERLWFCAMVDPAPAQQQALSSQLHSLAGVLPSADVVQSPLLSALKALPAADLEPSGSSDWHRATALGRVLRSLAAQLPLGGDAPRALLERAETSLRPAVMGLRRCLEGAEASTSARVAYGMAAELWRALPHVLRLNNGMMVKPLLVDVLLRPAPVGSESALLDLLPVALTGMCEVASTMQSYVQRMLCTVATHFLKLPGEPPRDTVLGSAADNPRLMAYLLRGLVLPHLQPHASASQPFCDHAYAVLAGLRVLKMLLLEAVPSVPSPLGGVVPDHLAPMELVLPPLLRLAVRTGLQTGPACKLSFDVLCDLLTLLRSAPAGASSRLAQLEARSPARSELLGEVLAFLGKRACLAPYADDAHVARDERFQPLLQGKRDQPVLARLDRDWPVDQQQQHSDGAGVLARDRQPLPDNRQAALTLNEGLVPQIVGLYDALPARKRKLVEELRPWLEAWRQSQESRGATVSREFAELLALCVGG